jgi:ABC-2 type transport system ATP-binding protein
VRRWAFLLKLDGVSSGYDEKEVLHSISVEVTNPAIYVVLGPNGAGKTTLFRTIAGVLKPYAGNVTLETRDLYSSNEARKDIGYLSHFSALPEEMTVYSALRFYAEIEGGSAEKAIDILELRELMNKKVSNLSQGQKKRASIAKLFLRERKLYLMDEPTSNLDPRIAKEVRDLLIGLSHEKFVLYSSHNLYEAQEIGDYIILIKDGKLAYFGPKEGLRTGEYKIGVKASKSLSDLFPEGSQEKDYFVISVHNHEDVGAVVKKIVDAGITVYEVKEIGNPLEEFFTGAR